MQDDSPQNNYKDYSGSDNPTVSASTTSQNVIPNQTFSTNDAIGQQTITPDGTAENMLRQIANNEVVLDDNDVSFEKSSSSSRLFGQNIAKIFGISAILLILI